MRQLQICLIGLAIGLGMVTTACSTAPKSATGQQDLVRDSNTTLQAMMNRDASLRPLLQRSAGYVVVPSVGKAGFIAGGAHGRGVLYQNGQAVGFIQLSQASLGAQIGAQSFDELVVFQNPADVERLKRGEWTFGGNASVVALTAGAGAATRFQGGTAVFINPRGGAMAELSISGQKLSFAPMGA
jgi:lipid-binding SYLF domain-containing protein